jgi:RNA recognition motif-containing protein
MAHSKLFVGNLGNEATENDREDFFEETAATATRIGH